jgi:hypothetical protein
MGVFTYLHPNLGWHPHPNRKDGKMSSHGKVHAILVSSHIRIRWDDPTSMCSFAGGEGWVLARFCMEKVHAHARMETSARPKDWDAIPKGLSLGDAIGIWDADRIGKG